MSRAQRCALLVGLAVMVVASTGCNPFAMGYFAGYALGLDKQMSVKVKFPPSSKIAIVTYAPHSTRIEWGQVDRELNDRLWQKAKAHMGESNKKYKTTLIPATTVYKWLDEHPDWHDMPLEEVAKGLGADFIVFLDIQTMSFFEPRSRFFYQGHAEVRFKVINVNPEYEGPGLHPEEFLTMDFPTEARPIPADSVPYTRFRRQFIERIAEKLSWYFVPHDPQEESKLNF